LPNAGEGGAPVIIRNLADAYQLYINLVNSAGSEIMLLLPAPSPERADVLRSALQSIEEAARRDVQVRVLTPASTKLPVNSNVTVRHVHRESGPDAHEVLIVDRKASLEYGIRDGPDDAVSIYSSSPSTAKSFVAMFDNLWDQSVEYEKFKETEHVKDEYIQKQRELYDKLREADRLKDEFINIAAHELRTPIQPLIGMAEMLDEQLKLEHKSEIVIGKAEVDMISRNARRLLNLSSDILQVSRIESKTMKLNKEPIDLAQKIENVVNDMRTIIPVGKRIMIRSEINSKNNVTVNGDRERIFEVLSNLITNAIKFTEEGEIVVSLEEKDGQAIVRVKDTGTGIAAEIYPKLFTKFTTKSDKGTGLGLFITKSIIEVHGGKIWAENNSGKGATFTFSLPLLHSVGTSQKKENSNESSSVTR
jgi:signal transduction histidine kinase